MREFSLTTAITAPPDRVWSLLTDFERYEDWNTIVPWARGSVAEGTRLDLRMTCPTGDIASFRPVIERVAPNRELSLAATLVHKRFLHMSHSFALHAPTAAETLLLQSWRVSGAMLPLAWSSLRKRMERFAIFGNDLKLLAETETQQDSPSPLRSS